MAAGNLRNPIQIMYKFEPTTDARQLSPSTSQRCRDYAWRRLNIRRSAARRPNMFQYRFQTRVAIAVDIVYRSSQYTAGGYELSRDVQT